MRQQVLLDTGPLVAYINRRELSHEWVVSEWANIEPPLLTCEAVITEACFLLQKIYRGEETVVSLVDSRVIQIPFQLSKEAVAVQNLLVRYQSVPMSLADACLVRMSELYCDSTVLTLDSDFLIYRNNKKQVISVVMPVK